MRLYCPFHADEDVAGVPVTDGTPEAPPGTYVFTCDRASDHPSGTEHSWVHVPELKVPGVSGLAEELGLGVDLPRILADFRGRWVEYGVVEEAYAAAHPENFALLVQKYGHTTLEKTTYSASTFLARTLGNIGRGGAIAFWWGPATGRWAYNSNISWWALPPAPPKDSRLSWEDTGKSMDYVHRAAR